MNEGTPNCDPSDASNPQGDCWGAGECKKQGEQGHRIHAKLKRCIWKEEFSELRGLQLPINRTLNSLIWYLVFDIQNTCCLCCKLAYSLTPLLPPCSTFLRATEMPSPGLRVLNVPPNKITLYFQVVTINFSRHFWSSYPTLPLLGLNPGKIRIWDDTHILVFRAAWFTRAKALESNQLSKNRNWSLRGTSLHQNPAKS